MKVTKYINVETEVDVDISLDDIVDAIAEGADAHRSVLTAFNNIFNFWNAIPDEIVAQITESQREIILDRMDAMAARLMGKV